MHRKMVANIVRRWCKNVAAKVTSVTVITIDVLCVVSEKQLNFLFYIHNFMDSNEQVVFIQQQHQQHLNREGLILMPERIYVTKIYE
jgi:hypothetical protein